MNVDNLIAQFESIASIALAGIPTAKVEIEAAPVTQSNNYAKGFNYISNALDTGVEYSSLRRFRKAVGKYYTPYETTETTGGFKTSYTAARMRKFAKALGEPIFKEAGGTELYTKRTYSEAYQVDLELALAWTGLRFIHINAVED